MDLALTFSDAFLNSSAFLEMNARVRSRRLPENNQVSNTAPPAIPSPRKIFFLLDIFVKE